MDKIQIFKHKLFGEIRTLTNENGETFFVGKDVAQALGYVKPENAVAIHVDAEDKTSTLIQGSGSNYKSKTIIINESGLYSLILSSKLSQAKAFKRWVTSEVLPQIRRTGGYIPTKDGQGHELTAEEILMKAHEIVGKTLRLLNAPNVNCLTATEVAKTWGMGVNDFNRHLCEMGIVYRRGGRLHLTKSYEGRGLAEDRVFFSYSLSGKPKSKTYLTWTPKGVEFLIDSVRMLADVSVPRAIQLTLIFI